MNKDNLVLLKDSLPNAMEQDIIQEAMKEAIKKVPSLQEIENISNCFEDTLT